MADDRNVLGLQSLSPLLGCQSNKEFPEIYRNLSLVPVFESHSEKLEIVLAGVHEVKRPSKTSQDLLSLGGHWLYQIQAETTVRKPSHQAASHKASRNNEVKKQLSGWQTEIMFPVTPTH